jgi:hypothetical protein
MYTFVDVVWWKLQGYHSSFVFSVVSHFVIFYTSSVCLYTPDFMVPFLFQHSPLCIRNSMPLSGCQPFVTPLLGWILTRFASFTCPNTTVHNSTGLSFLHARTEPVEVHLVFELLHLHDLYGVWNIWVLHIDLPVRVGGISTVFGK